jgi:hypothetical protein
VSVEDSYGCKRSISVPGVSVNVRRVKVGCCYHGIWARFDCVMFSQPLSFTASMANGRLLF